MRTALLAVAALSLSVGACASVSRSASYGMEFADAQPIINGRPYRIYVHPVDQTLLLQRPVATAMGQSAVGGLTLGLAEPGTAYAPWKEAAAEFIKPAGCSATDVYDLGGGSMTWEAKYTCPEGVDLRALIMAQRPALRSGAPLKP